MLHTFLSFFTPNGHTYNLACPPLMRHQTVSDSKAGSLIVTLTIYSECDKSSLPGGVQVSMGDWTKAERRLVGIGSAIFSSLCLASAACTASVWMSTSERINREKQISKVQTEKKRIK